jgi:hypothetical protein
MVFYALLIYSRVKVVVRLVDRELIPVPQADEQQRSSLLRS